MAWLLSVAHTPLADALRREGPRAVALHDARFDSISVQSFHESIGRRSAASPGLEILLRAVVEVSSELSAADAALLWMRLIAEDEWATIGVALGISATAARRRFQRMQKTMGQRVRASLQSLPLVARRLAHEWLSKHLNEQLDASDQSVAEDPRD